MQLRMRWPAAAVATAAGLAVAVIAFAWLAWGRRWMSDDGLIVVRTVRQLLAGNGPVLNACERVEADTSTLWTYVLAVVAGATGGDVSITGVFTGLVLAIAGVALALDATRRWHRARGVTGALVPAGIAVVLGVFGFWDYATSGLETGLATLWAAAIWWLIVTVGAAPTRRRLHATAFVLGLGPLVRPELAVATAAFGTVAWLIARPPRRLTIALVAVGVALPIAYEVFRAGYYGTLVPLPALAKSASHAEWGRGLAYVLDVVQPAALWLPLGVLAALATVAVAKRRVARDQLVVAAAPLATAVVLAVYVMRVGGDFMHARMMLPSIWFAVMPGLVLPLRRATVPVIVALAGWATWAGVTVDDARLAGYERGGLVENERSGYARWTHHAQPIDADVFIAAARPASTEVLDAVAAGRHVLVTEDGRVTVPLDVERWPDTCNAVAFGYGRLGTGGATVPLDGFAVDTLGLGNPVGARITATNPGMPGHEKPLPLVWQAADFAAPDAVVANVMPAELAAARHALGCGAVAELLASAREPLTMSRFFDNLTGAVARTRLSIPVDPFEAEWAFCDVGLDAVRVVVSSSYDLDNWSRDELVDGVRARTPTRMGFSTRPGNMTDHAEWIEVRYAVARPVSAIVLYPEPNGDGFPVDLTVQVWDGEQWLDRVTKTGLAAPDTPQTYAWSPVDTTDRVRLVANHLRTVLGGYVLQLAEIETR